MSVFLLSRTPILDVQSRSSIQLQLKMDTPTSEITEQFQLNKSELKHSGDAKLVDEISLQKNIELPTLEFLRIDCANDAGAKDKLDPENHSKDLDMKHSDTVCSIRNMVDFDSVQDVGDLTAQVNEEAEATEKIPNRDSGIDSPSCGTEGEVFPNECTIEEEEKNGSMDVETENITTSNKRDSTQDEDSDLGGGSSEEPESPEVKVGLRTNKYLVYQVK